jgi:hypothetical protein
MQLRTKARARIAGVVAFTALIVSGCSARREAVMESVYTSLSAASCNQAVDKGSPDETPYLSCPGLAGYVLNVRRVEAGRSSIDVVDAAQHQFPLNFQDVVTRSMCSLDDKAEWRVSRRNGEPMPSALIVAVHSREDQDDPAKITSTYFAIAKITSATVCVTDRIVQGIKVEAEVRALADSARNRPCAPELPRAAATIHQP